MKEKSLRFLGLLRRGGNVEIGEGVKPSLKRANVMILADDASGPVKRELTKEANFHHVYILTGVTKEALGGALGFASISAAAVVHAKAGKKLRALWEEDTRAELNQEGETHEEE